MAGYDGAVIIDAQINTKNASSQMVQLENRMAKAADKVDLLNKKLEKMGNTKLPTDEYREIQSQIDTSEKKLNSLVDRMEKWKELGKSTSSSTFRSMQYEVDELTKTIQYAKGEKQALIESGGAYIDPRSTEEYQNLTNQIRYASGEMQVLAKRHEELAAKQEQVSRGAKKSGGALESFGKRVGGLAKRIFVFSLITKAFRAMVSAVQEGLKNYAQYSSEYNKSMSDFSSAAATLKNSLATAAGPILSALVPALTTLCTWLTTAVNLISKFVAFLSGKNTWTRAKKQQIDYAKSLNNTSKAADKAKTSLAGFDDLDVLQKDDSSGGGTGGGGETTGAGAFEEVGLTDDDIALFQKVKDILMAILPIAVAIGAAILTWKLTSFLTNLMAAHPILGTIASVLAIIAGAALAVVSYFHMWKDGVDWPGLIGYITGVALVFAGLMALGQPLVAGITLIVAGLWGLALGLKDVAENGLTVQNVSLLLVSAVGLVVGVFMTFGGAAAAVLAVLLAIAGAFLYAMQRAGTLSQAIGYLKTAFSAFGQFLKEIFAGDFKAAFRSILVFAISIFNFIITAFEAMVNWIIDGLNAMIKAAVSIINKVPGINFTAPEFGHVDWSGKKIQVPELANGGITAGTTLARIGEAGREAVLPLENNLEYLDKFADKIAERIPAAQTGPVYLQIDGKTFATLYRPYGIAEDRRVGTSFT